MSDTNELIHKANKVLQENIDDKYDVNFLFTKYPIYENTVLEFIGDKNSLKEIIKLYKDDLKEYLSSNTHFKDMILYDGKFYRHDLDFSKEVDLDFVIESIFSDETLSGFNKRARDILLFETMNMFNLYGMEQLRTNSTIVKKEMDYGIFLDKATTKNKNHQELMRLGDKYGKDAIEYLLNLDLLKERVESLVKLVDNSIFPELKSLYGMVDQYITARDDITSTLQLNPDNLKMIFDAYEKINKSTIVSLLDDSVSDYITEPTGELLMLHFIPDGSDNMFDSKMNKFLMNELINSAQESISRKNGRPFDEELDKKDLEESITKYKLTRANPFDLQGRIPLRSNYFIGKGDLWLKVITAPTTHLSVSISSPEDLKIHLDRKIAIGFLPQDVPIDAIVSTSKTYNSEPDRYDFHKDSHSAKDIVDFTKTNPRSNETVIDWTKVKPSYIFVVKDKETLEPELYQRALELQKQNNLPIKIFDQYALSLNSPRK